MRGDVGKADRGVVNLRHKAQLARYARREERRAGHPHPKEKINKEKWSFLQTATFFWFINV